LNKIKDIEQAIFYIQNTIENAWSRNILELQIESKLFERQGKSVIKSSQKKKFANHRTIH